MHVDASRPVCVCNSKVVPKLLETAHETAKISRLRRRLRRALGRAQIKNPVASRGGVAVSCPYPPQGSLIINTNKYLINNHTYNTKYESSRIVLYCCITTAARTHTRARLPGAEHPVPQQAAPKLCLHTEPGKLTTTDRIAARQMRLQHLLHLGWIYCYLRAPTKKGTSGFTSDG